MTNQVIQTFGLVLDLIGVIIIVHGFKKVTVKESSQFGLVTNMGEVLTKLRNEARIGSAFLVLGFTFQLIGLWF